MTGRGPEGVVRAQQWQSAAVETCTDSVTWLPNQVSRESQSGERERKRFRRPTLVPPTMSSDSPRPDPAVDAHNDDFADSRATTSTLTRQGSDDADDAPTRPLSQEAESLDTDTAGDQRSTGLTAKESASDDDPWQAVFSAECVTHVHSIHLT